MFFYVAEGEKLKRSIVGINWQNKLRADSVHENQKAFENILLILLTMIPQMQHDCLENREADLKPTDATIRLQNQKQVKKRKIEEKDAMLSQQVPGFALCGGLTPPLWRWVMAPWTTDRHGLCQSSLMVPGRQT